MSEPDLFTDPTAEPPAIFSPCRRYRYELWRRWAAGPFVQFIGLNPSTADETNNDPTVRRCIDFAKRWGFAALCMTNAFAFRATDPADMKAEPAPIGPDNDATLSAIAARAGLVVAAWGVHGSHLDRERQLLTALPRLHCLGITAAGHPKHPLYIKATTQPQPYQKPAD